MSKKKKYRGEELPTRQQLENELERETYKYHYRATIRNIIFGLIVAAAGAILISTLLLPVFRIYGTSMTHTLEEGDMVAAVKTENLHQGDLVAFYYNNKILVKRVIATSGQWVDIDKDGNVYVDDALLYEPYLGEKSLGQCDIELPYQVPDEKIFVMGDHRNVSVDSRTNAVGCVAQEQIVGRLIFRIWPFEKIGLVDM